MFASGPPGLDERNELLAVSRTELDDRRQARHARQKLPPVTGEQPQFCSRDAVRRQPADILSAIDIMRFEDLLEAPEAANEGASVSLMQAALEKLLTQMREHPEHWWSWDWAQISPRA